MNTQGQGSGYDAVEYTISWEALQTEKDVQSYRGLIQGEPGNTPMHRVEYDWSVTYGEVDPPSPGRFTLVGRGLRASVRAAFHDRDLAGFFSDDSDTYSPPESLSRNNTEPVFEEETNEEMMDNEDEVATGYIQDASDADRELEDQWVLVFDMDLCECGSQCETVDPEQCSQSLWGTLMTANAQ